MEINEIKQSLNILTVLNHYGLKPDRNKQIRCPFHDDKTPSLQVYEKTGTYNCFGCGANGDTIQFIQDFEKLNKHQAIEKAKTLCNGHTVNNTKPIIKMEIENQTERKEIITKAWEYFNQASKSNSKQLKDYLESRNLDPLKTEIGYNSGQFHHRKSAELVKQYAKYNLLLPGKSPSKTGLSFTPWQNIVLSFH